MLNFFSGYEAEHVALVAQIVGAVFVLGCGYVWRSTHKALPNET